MYATRIPDFRRRLIERIVREDPWIARSVAGSGGQAEFAPQLGLQPDILEQAAHLFRRGARSEDGNLDVTRLGRLRLRVLLTPEENVKLKAYADSRNMLKGATIRVLMHAAMRTSREPSPHAFRVPRKPGEAPPAELRRHTCEIAPKVTRGLHDAIVQRAAAYGVGFKPYVRYWVVDLVEGRLADLDIPIVPFLGLFDDAKSYVLPAWDKAG
jgi:hypothetical protein